MNSVQNNYLQKYIILRFYMQKIMNDNLLDKESSIIVVLKYSGYETINRKIIKNLH